MNGDSREDHLQFLKSLLENGETLYVTKNIDDIFYQGTLSSENDENFIKYTNGDFLVLPEKTLFSLLKKNAVEQILDKQWMRIPESLWRDNLDVMPPLKYEFVGENEFFFNQEAMYGNMNSCYAQVDGKYYTAVKSRADHYQNFLEEIRMQVENGGLKENIFADKIKIAMDDGYTVYWGKPSYVVEKSCQGYGGYDIVCTFNNYRFGLTHRDNVTLNGKDEEFIFVKGDDVKKNNDFLLTLDLVPYPLTIDGSVLTVKDCTGSVLWKLNNSVEVTGNRFSEDMGSSFIIRENNEPVFLDFYFSDNDVQVSFTPKLKEVEMVDAFVDWVDENYDAMEDIGYEVLSDAKSVINTVSELLPKGEEDDIVKEAKSRNTAQRDKNNNDEKTTAVKPK